jgi:aspartyl-tRNA(Asn)/glutamyl-tRNA(Gln) amidotransferase subunit B
MQTTPKWEPVIGLEIHVQLATRSKMFSGAATAYGARPNSQACAIDLGFPGVLPAINEAAVRMAITFGLAVDAAIAETCVFARKNYFYPDLPKGYQISQYEQPIVTNGALMVARDDGSRFKVRITRAHLEEDAGKSLHEDFHGMTGIDLNRAGTPLLEVVSEPDLRSAADAVAYMRALHTLVRYLGICDGNMQEGSFRCDANVSVRRAGTSKLGTRTETKNLNSFRFVERAIEHEIARQIEVLEGGGQVVQETRLYDSDRDETRPLRTKEDAHDYRYFPDPDLLPLRIETSLIETLRARMPELPAAKYERFIERFGLSATDAATLCRDRAIADYFEGTVEAAKGNARSSAHWITGELFGALNRSGIGIEAAPITPAMLGGLIARIEDGTISGKIAKDVFEAMWNGAGDADRIIAARGLTQLSDSSQIEAFVEQVIRDHPEQVKQFQSGKDKILGFLVGQVMKLTGGKANPQRVNEVLRVKLAEPGPRGTLHSSQFPRSRSGGLEGGQQG